MFAPSLDRQTAPVNLARPLLRVAQQSEARGDLIAAGCQLREALRRQLVAMCVQFGCLPKRAERRTPMILRQSLRQTGALDDATNRLVRAIIHVGNCAAHCRRVERAALRGAILALYGLIDRFPCGECQFRSYHPQRRLQR